MTKTTKLFLPYNILQRLRRLGFAQNQPFHFFVQNLPFRPKLQKMSQTTKNWPMASSKSLLVTSV